MAGDLLTASSLYYYQNAVTNTTGNNLTTSVLNALIQNLTGSSTASPLLKGNASQVQPQLSATSGFNALTASDANNAAGHQPQGLYDYHVL